MGRSFAGTVRVGAGVVLALAVTLALFGASGASADVQHGIGFQKGCESPTKVGDPVLCRYAVANNNFTNESLDTVTFNYVADVTHAAGGDTPETNILGSLELYVTFGTPTCVHTGGSGTFADPWTGVTSCTLPGGNILIGNGSSIESKNHAGYVVQPADFNLPNHQLNDDAKLHWNDVCDVAPQNCNTNQQTQTAPSATIVVRRASQTATDIHNGQHQVVTTVGVGTTVHDFITVTTADPDPNNPIPHGGNVFLEWFENGTCTGNAAASATVGPVDATGHFDATGFPQTPNVAGHYAFRGHYLGDGTYDASDGPCEPLTVVDANIQITPNGVNRVGATHTFTATVNVNNGNGFAPAPDGTLVTFTIDSDTASSLPNPPASCTTIGGSCTTSISSATTGVTTVSAHTTLAVGGVTLTRHTDTTHGSSGPATKRWVNAKIAIAPNATNEVGAPHTFTVTLQKDAGDGAGFVAAAGEHVNFTLTDSNGAVSILNAAASTCDDAGPNTNASGQCTIVFTSNSAGKVTGHASSTLSVAGSAPFTVQTDGVAPNSGDAVKTFVDANIQITPNGVNRVGQTHTFTAHVNVNDGNGFTPAPNGTQISFTIDSGPGAFTSPNPCTTSGGTGSCTIDLSSAVTGVTTVSAHTTVSVGGLLLTRHTNGTGANSGPATKRWVNARIAIAPNATNEVGAPHTFTVTLQKDAGDGLGFVAAAGEHVAFTLTDSNGAVSILNAAASTCDDAGANTNASGQCTIVFTSNSAGKVTGHASSTLSVAGSAPFTVQTDGVAPNSGDAVKTFVDANIQITPNGVNRVGQTHTFTAHVNVNDGNGFTPAPNGTQISFTIDSGPGSFTSVNPCTTSGGTGSCTIDLSSAITGVTTVSAHTTVSVGGLLLTRHTNGAGANSGPATKRWVNARISITPNATNLVTQSHTFTVTLEKDIGDGNGFVAAAGEHVDVALADSNGATHGVPTGTCTNAGANTDAAGHCAITFASNSAGTVTGHASSTLSVAGSAAFKVETDGIAPNSGDAVKTFVNAKIAIAPNATNEVGKSHTFTVTLMKDTGNGAGFVPAANEHVTVTLTDANGASHSAPTGTCTNGGANTDANGQCTITFLSNTAGTVTGHASSTLSVAGSAPFTVQTNGVAPNSGDAVKTFVDANIQISPLTANNPVSTNHTLTGHVNINAGNGAGYVNAPAGTSITFALTNSGGATAAFVGPSSCTTAGATGSCTVVISSSTTGTTTVKATTTVTVGGVPLTRATGDAKLGDSADASKTWADDTVRTDIHNAAHAVILTAVAGTIVHDNVQVAKAAGTPASVPNPSGSVIFHRYATINCSGAAVNQTVALTPGSPSTAESDTFAPTADMSYQAEYLGDANYPAHMGACEPLTVTPLPQPSIAIVKNPKAQVVAVNGTARFTITVTNTGNVTLTDVHVVDPLSPNCNRTKADIPALASMAPGAAVTYSCTRPNMKCTGPNAPYKSCAVFTNVATAIGTPPSGPDVTATDSAPVKVAPLQPKKRVKPKIISHKKPKATG